jgi:mRNA interferase MazF
MTTYNFGDIILIGFPHTDLRGVSKRPAVVPYDSGDQDILVARITTQAYSTEADYKVIEWKKCGLLTESYIRAGKEATIEKQYIVRRLGALSVIENENLKAILRQILSL